MLNSKNRLNALNASALDMAFTSGHSEVKAFLEKKTSIRLKSYIEINYLHFISKTWN